MQFERTDRKALDAELIAEASRDAQTRAERMAAGFGQLLGSVQAISQEEMSDISHKFTEFGTSYAGAEYKGRRTAEQLLVPATIPLREAVNAIFKLAAD